MSIHFFGEIVKIGGIKVFARLQIWPSVTFVGFIILVCTSARRLLQVLSATPTKGLPPRAVDRENVIWSDGKPQQSIANLRELKSINHTL